jgi:transcriptional regulator with XRE-family HTH domain
MPVTPETRPGGTWDRLYQAPEKLLVHHGGVEPENLSGFLRQARTRVSPADVGLPAGTRRRVVGLRREEVAQLANISVDYLVRLEQGRGAGVSDAVLAALARALQLSDDERAHLFYLAGSAPPRPGQIDGVVRASTLRVLERLVDLPAMVLDAKSDVLAWNALAAALLGDFSAWAPPTRNLVWQRFLGVELRVSTSAEEGGRTAAESVASLRVVAARYPEDVGLRRLIDQLRSGSQSFVGLWDQTRPQERRSSTKTIRHPELGIIELDCDSLHMPESDQRMIVYSAPLNSPAADALALLRVIGLQQLERSGPPESGSPRHRP